jgi:hypothetical protein
MPTHYHAVRASSIHPVLRPGDNRDCWRCGVSFNPLAENVIPLAPCRDCRETLRSEGDQTVWGVRAAANRRVAA